MLMIEYIHTTLTILVLMSIYEFAAAKYVYVRYSFWYASINYYRVAKRI